MNIRKLFNRISAENGWLHVARAYKRYSLLERDEIRIARALQAFNKEFLSQPEINTRFERCKITAKRINTSYEVFLCNADYVEPPDNLKPWGGDGETAPPEGYYDCNRHEHILHYGFQVDDWYTVSNLEITDMLGLHRFEFAALFIIDVVSFGWTVEQQKQSEEELKQILDERKDEEYIPWEVALEHLRENL